MTTATDLQRAVNMRTSISTSTSTCTRCGAAFSCAMAEGKGEPCWCTALPAAVPVPQQAAGCWCRACLEAHIGTLARD